MQLDENWDKIKRLFKQSFRSSFHYAIATVNEHGEPHVTPIGSLILGDAGQGMYFEEYPSQLPHNFETNKQVCVLAVNSSPWFWLKSLIRGRFVDPPAIRLYGIAGEVRAATDIEIALLRRRVRKVSFTKGHAILWKNMSKVREIKFSRMEPVLIGEMTRGTWSALSNSRDN
ncbi:MAG: pyridoxamine 5'-phosphate oxidase family protein [Anaerolineales bacterium]|nr:pyridoxamine 5'-phosphate oxidase family protein [Anaerolineales bacterium]